MAKKVKQRYKDLTSTEKQKIEALYLSGQKPKQISEKLNINVQLIYTWVKNNKKCPAKKQIETKIQELLAGEIFRQGVEDAAELAKTNKLLHQAIRQQINNFESTKDLQALTTAFKNIFSISQLIDDKPTEIIHETSMNVDFTPEQKEVYLSWRKELDGL